MKVYQKVVLPPQMFDRNNNVHMTTIKKEGINQVIIADNYTQKSQVQTIKDGDPLKGEGLLQREKYQIIRLSDGFVMAESTKYGRVGGDGAFHVGFHTQSRCPLVEGGLVPKVFNKYESR